MKITKSTSNREAHYFQIQSEHSHSQYGNVAVIGDRESMFYHQF